MPANVLVRRYCSENRVHNGIVFGLKVDESFSKIDKYIGYLECEDNFEKRPPQVPETDVVQLIAETRQYHARKTVLQNTNALVQLRLRVIREHIYNHA